ncbi:4'-phosphopantetheinyl transferase family protein [Maribacter sp. 2307UL18-2]|uniref:4'-phosphopantetheinyl transferase family protein n=1 Tax=Maribacter sp. 2307UL18-2 TaxID=3386274 RepID=UPI0039BD9027
MKIHVFYSYISYEFHHTLFKNYLSRFPDDFQRKVLSFRRWQDSQLSLLGRLLLQYGLEHCYKKNSCLPINYTIYKKPYIDDEMIQFSISHSKEIAICAITTSGEIGVDIEFIKPVNINDFKHQMTQNEWGLLDDLNNSENAFYTYWTQKEAVIKANGMGFHLPLKSFEVVANQSVLNAEIYSLKQLIVDKSYICHIAVRGCLDWKSNSCQVKELVFNDCF